MQRCKHWIVWALVVVAATVATGSQVDAQQPDETARRRAEYALGMYAKLLCSGVFVIGRESDEFIGNDLSHYANLDLPDWKDIKVDVDRTRKRVTLSMAGLSPRTAVYLNEQGCALVPLGETEFPFKPVPVASTLPDAKTTPWPMGDVVDRDQLPSDVDQSALAAALDFAFDDSAQPVPQKTRAMVIVYKGQIVGERYAPGFDQDTRHISWSMGKSVTAALVGILVGAGHFKVDDPAPIAAWRTPGDPRGKIKIAHLLRMSSGLKFGSPSDPRAMFTEADNHRYVYFGAVDVFDYSTRREAEFPPDTVWRYRNCDPLSLGLVIRQTVEARGENYHQFPQRALFDRIGMRRMVLEVDPRGNFIMTGFDYGTARDWARFGLLHLNDGVWQGERILPEGWIDTVTTPAPANKAQHYGGLVWLNRGGTYPKLPRDMYWPAGHHGQVVLIIPSRQMVVVRLGHSASNGFDAYLEPVVEKILASVGT